jgi:hypothetical protein
MAGNKHDNGVHEIGTDEIRIAYQNDTPGQSVERYIEDRNKAYHEEAKEKKKKHFSQVFDNPLKGFPYNEEFVVSLKESIVEVEEAKELELSLPMRGFMQDTRKELFGWAKKSGLNPKKIGSGSAEKLEIKGTPKQINKLISYIPVKDVKEESVAKLDEDVSSFLLTGLTAFMGVNAVAFIGLIASEMAGIDIIGKTEKAIENIKSKFKRNKNYKPSKSELETLKKVGQEIKKKDPNAYKKAQQKVNSMKESFEPLEENADASLKKKAEKTGIPFGILKKVYNRGVAAWKTGHRPGTTPEQWGHARVNSFATKSKGTWGGADKDLAKQVG